MIPFNQSKKIIAFVATGIILFILTLIIGSQYIEKRDSKYPVLGIESYVKSNIHKIKRRFGVILVDFFNDEKYSIESSQNYQYDPFDLYYFAEPGDSILKELNNDTLILKRDGVEYLFILGKELNKDLEK